MRKSKARDWTKEKDAKFLSVLAETCNVTLAALDAGVSVGGAYKRRRENAAFRAGWMEAICSIIAHVLGSRSAELTLDRPVDD